MRKPHFKENESYLHKLAKDVLTEWITNYPECFGLTNVTSIRHEEAFCENGIILFKPDVCVYEDSELSKIYEICHTSAMTGYKLHKIQFYRYHSASNFNVY